ncbi:hypothetical protein [Tenacibaculum singaporense]|uniref:GH16 domain-containing protein n=1 Tax=Tenacibaculum singaporense TaxID=2358479 RepID=A0A3S8R6F6_9FLAO|nr:hypothetical protein [Tenacibaculum singaporense]AZJ35348.1 hypothetical protein D6T69_07355 [Tenacibaculum singaporense]
MYKSDSCILRNPMPSGAIEPNENSVNGMLEFDGYYWWTNYPFGISYSGYWFNNQQWDPRCATVDSDGLHLKMKETQLPNGPKQWSSVELVLWGKVANNPNTTGNPPQRMYPGYGKYLVAAETPVGNFNDIANNCCFGVFTYQFEKDSSITNSHRELDMLECSRWNNLSNPTNAQFTLQPWEPAGNVHRITLRDKGKITIVMDWKNENTPVIYSIYYGIYDLNSLPGKPDISWTTAASQNQYIPNEGCQTVHLNLWRQPQNYTPSEEQEVVIKKFQYKRNN